MEKQAKDTQKLYDELGSLQSHVNELREAHENYTKENSLIMGELMKRLGDLLLIVIRAGH